MKKVLIILGSTSSGKTDLALTLAKKFHGELISADSRQVYKNLDLGTGKLPDRSVKFQKEDGVWVIDGVKVWGYDLVDTSTQFTAYDFVRFAQNAINEITKLGKLPIIVGGTGLYIKSLIQDLPNLSVVFDPILRKKLEKLTLMQMQQNLQSLSIDKWNSMNNSDRQNPRRLIRALEICLNKDKKEENKIELEKYDVLKIGLKVQRSILFQRINKRVEKRVNLGMIEEAENLYKLGLSIKRMKELGLEYGVLADYILGKIKTREEVIKILEKQIQKYAKRQETWFKKERDINWFDINEKKYTEKVEKLVLKWYHHFDAKKN